MRNYPNTFFTLYALHHYLFRFHIAGAASHPNDVKTAGLNPSCKYGFGPTVYEKDADSKRYLRQQQRL